MATTIDQLPDHLDSRFNDMGWGLLLFWPGVVWLLPAGTVPPGTGLLGVATVLLGVTVARYASQRQPRAGQRLLDGDRHRRPGGGDQSDLAHGPAARRHLPGGDRRQPGPEAVPRQARQVR